MAGDCTTYHPVFSPKEKPHRRVGHVPARSFSFFSSLGTFISRRWRAGNTGLFGYGKAALPRLRVVLTPSSCDRKDEEENLLSRRECRSRHNVPVAGSGLH